RADQPPPPAQAHVVHPLYPGFPVDAHFFASPPPDDSTNSTNRACTARVEGAWPWRVISRVEKSCPRNLSSRRKRSRYGGTSSGRLARPAMEASPPSSEKRIRVSHTPSTESLASARRTLEYPSVLPRTPLSIASSAREP